jgi:hypothetical protein
MIHFRKRKKYERLLCSHNHNFNFNSVFNELLVGKKDNIFGLEIEEKLFVMTV